MKCSVEIEIKYILFMTKDLSSLKLHTELYVSCKRDLIPPCVFLVPPSPLITSKAPLSNLVRFRLLQSPPRQPERGSVATAHSTR